MAAIWTLAIPPKRESSPKIPKLKVKMLSRIPVYGDGQPTIIGDRIYLTIEAG